MTTAIGEKRYTLADLELLDDPERYELIDGDLVERAMGYESDVLGAGLLIRVGGYVLEHNLGRVAQAGTGLNIFGRADMIPRPDGVFVSRERSRRQPEQGFLETVPDIAWEVVSPNENATRLRQKVAMYLEAGIRLVWVMWPAASEIDVYRPDGTRTVLRASDHLTGEDVLLGFSVQVGDLFATVGEVAE